MSVWAADLAKYLGKELFGKNILVIKPCSVNGVCSGGLLFLKKFSYELSDAIADKTDIVAIVAPQYAQKLRCTYIVSENPRLDFARALQEYFAPRPTPGISATVKMGNNIIMGRYVTIGEYGVIGSNVIIGDNTVIRHHVVIGDNVEIGSNCVIKSHTVIGEEGFGFERNVEGVPVRIPHLGSVKIGNNVEVGASSVICRGTLDDTFIADNVKIDDAVFIAHNVRVGCSSMIIAGAEISGSAVIGKNCWLGPNCSIMNGISIGANCYIGLGTVVNKSLTDNLVVAGSPARILRHNGDDVL